MGDFPEIMQRQTTLWEASHTLALSQSRERLEGKSAFAKLGCSRLDLEHVENKLLSAIHRAAFYAFTLHTF